MDVFRLAISIIICQGVGFVGSMFTRRAIPERRGGISWAEKIKK